MTVAGSSGFHVVEGSASSPSAFFPAVNVQLLDLLGQAGGVATDESTQAMQFLALWERALTTLGGRVVLVVDGLDEQDRQRPISSHLPIHCPPTATVVVATRPNPDLAAVVDGHHPLATRGFHARYRLLANAHAKANEHQARRTVNDFLERAERTGEDVVGFLAFAEGPLSRDELAELVGVEPGRCDVLLDGLARHLRVQVDHDGAGRGLENDRFVTRAIDHELERGELAQLVDELERDLGPPDATMLAEAAALFDRAEPGRRLRRRPA